MAGEAGAADAFVAQLRERFGLDKPLPQQLATYLGHAARLDLGDSYRQQRPVMSLIGERLPATLLLTLTAFVVSLTLGVALGAWSSARAGTWLDSLVSTLSMLFYATPLFWLALMECCCSRSSWNGCRASASKRWARATGLARAADIARHLVLPATLALFYMAVYARMTRTAMLEVAQMDFIKTARAKGLSPRRIQRRHILRNALLPVITLAGIQAGSMVGGTVLIETVFAWPGIGRLMFDALVQRDYNLLLGTFLITAALAVAFNIITDLLYTLADPRIELQ